MNLPDDYDYYEEFYGETSEFAEKIEELKDSLMESVKDEIHTELVQLKKENLELQEIKNNFDEIKSKYRMKELEFERELESIEKKVRKERLSELTKDIQINRYKARVKRKEKLPKCDKCDEERKRWFTKPSGRPDYEFCECDEEYLVYHPERYIMVEFSDLDNKNMFYEIRTTYDDEEDYFYLSKSGTHAEAIYKEGMNYRDLNIRKTFFDTEEDCRKYCDWLNENAKQK